MAQNDSLSEFLQTAVEAAKRAGEIIREGFYQTKHVEHKGLVDLVTETDKACEDLIFNYLKQQHPSHKVPLCVHFYRSYNWKSSYSRCCLQPNNGRGVHGKGAFLNGKPIKVSSQSELVKSLLATEVGTKRDKSTVDATTNRINSLLFKVRSLRMTGSCALNLCGIACGRIDLFYLTGYGGPWDVAGGAVIVKEARGIIYDPSGKDFDITSQRVAASNPLLKEAFVEVLQQSE
uniref:inositol-phosphate phosphatase n=1 Tax=Populus alba TaxID=43335 RepID=A0A4U5NPD8_POPAL|nr:hypothetical protein D5086_0000254160 [Populus alba]